MIYRTIDKRLDSNAILQHKPLLMGMSMLSVVFYHAYCVHADIFTSLFKYGFVGVDIFILINALGCSYSYEKNGIWRFWLNRIKRVYGMFVIYATIRTGLYAISNDVCIVDYICNITTMSYYGIDGQFMDWYISASFLLWLSFPMLYKLVDKFGYLAIIIALVMSLYIITQRRPVWYHTTLIARIPLFMLGIKLKTTSVSPLLAIIFGVTIFICSNSNLILAISIFSICLLSLYIYRKVDITVLEMA